MDRRRAFRGSLSGKDGSVWRHREGAHWAEGTVRADMAQGRSRLIDREGLFGRFGRAGTTEMRVKEGGRRRLSGLVGTGGRWSVCWEKMMAMPKR